MSIFCLLFQWTHWSMKYTKGRPRHRNWAALSSLLCYVDIDHSDRCFRRYLLHNLSLPELLCRRSSVVVASESDSWLRGGWAGMVASSLRCQREHDSAGLGSAQPSRSHSLARAATSSTALHWVESRHCTALHQHNDTAEYLPAGQTLLQCNAKFAAVTTTLCNSEIITWTLDRSATIMFSILLRNDEQCAADQNVTL